MDIDREAIKQQIGSKTLRKKTDVNQGALSIEERVSLIEELLLEEVVNKNG